MNLRRETELGSLSTALLEGFIIDQAALHGILNKIADLGLKLLYVQHLDTE